MGVTGIGGIFLKFKDPKKMKDWYQQVLGIITNDYGILFSFGGPETSEAFLQMATFPTDTKYFGESGQQ